MEVSLQHALRSFIHRHQMQVLSVLGLLLLADVFLPEFAFVHRFLSRVFGILLLVAILLLLDESQNRSGMGNSAGAKEISAEAFPTHPSLSPTLPTPSPPRMPTSTSVPEQVRDGLTSGSQRGTEIIPRVISSTSIASLGKDGGSSEGTHSVVIFTHSMERNGANMVAYNLAKELVRKGGMEVTAVTPKAGPMEEDFIASGCTVKTMVVSTDEGMKELQDFLRKGSWSLAVVNTLMRSETVVAAAAAQIPTLFVVHESWPRKEIESYAKKVFLTPHIGVQVIERAFRVATTVIFPARVQQNIYRGMFRDEACRVIYNGIPLEKLDEYQATNSREAARSELGYTPDDLLVLHLGTVCKRKGQNLTVRAFAGAVENGDIPNGKLLMVGARYIRQHEIDFQKELKEFIASRGLEARAKIMDIQKDVRPFLLAADIVVVPSLNEVLPLVLCEAGAFRRPVIASRIDGIPEAISDGVEGFLIERGNIDELQNRLVRLAKDPELRVAMGNAGRSRVERQFSFATMTDAYINLIREAITAAKVSHVSNMRSVDRVSPSEDDEDDEDDEEEETEEEGDGDSSAAESDSNSSIMGGFSTISSKAPKRRGRGLLRGRLGRGVGRRRPRSYRLATPGQLSGTLSTHSSFVGGGIEVPAALTAAVPVKKPEPRIILVDMDSTIVDFDGSFLKRWSVDHPGDVALVRGRRHFELEKNFPESVRDEVVRTIAEPGLYRSMEPYEGALDALAEMLAEGFEVKLVTSPHPACYASCAAEKFAWVAEKLGAEWCARTTISRDKTSIAGDVLIDDKPEVVGVVSHPTWEHLLFDQPWNRSGAHCSETIATKLRIEKWSDWKKVIHAALDKNGKPWPVVEKAVTFGGSGEGKPVSSIEAEEKKAE